MCPPAVVKLNWHQYMENPWLAFSGYIIAAVSIAANLWQVRLRRKADKEKEIRERRYEVYSEYLSKLDAVNSKLYTAQFSEEMQNDILDLFRQISEAASSESVSSEQAAELQSRFIGLMSKNFEIMSEWMEEQNKLLDELNKVRLVASDEVAELLDDYSDAVQSVIESSMGLPMEFAMKGPGHVDFETMLHYGKLMEELKRIKRELHSAMRRDIGVE